MIKFVSDTIVSLWSTVVNFFANLSDFGSIIMTGDLLIILVISILTGAWIWFNRTKKYISLFHSY